MDDVIAREIVERTAAGEQFAVGLLAHVQGSAPQKAGARIIVLPDGTLRGTVGGGCLEMEARRRALIALRTGEPDLFELRLDDDFGWDDGLICGGRTTLLVCPHPERSVPALAEALAARDAGRRATLVTVLAAPDPARVGDSFCLPPEGGAVNGLPLTIPEPGVRPAVHTSDAWRVLAEPIRPNPMLVVMGCGHIGAALAEMAASVGFDVVAVDDRADYASPVRLPWAKQVVCEDLPSAARTLPTGPDTYWVIVTRGHRNDGRVLAEVINRPLGYLGMIGSRRKVRLIREGLLESGATTSERLGLLHSPVGLDIGAESPREIALSIVAQLVAARYGKATRV
jgi:xanthine dehydrogenase accessory factor